MENPSTFPAETEKVLRLSLEKAPYYSLFPQN
jgi:hypothetical protein